MEGMVYALLPVTAKLANHGNLQARVCKRGVEQAADWCVGIGHD